MRIITNTVCSVLNYKMDWAYFNPLKICYKYDLLQNRFIFSENGDVSMYSNMCGFSLLFIASSFLNVFFFSPTYFTFSASALVQRQVCLVYPPLETTVILIFSDTSWVCSLSMDHQIVQDWFTSISSSLSLEKIFWWTKNSILPSSSGKKYCLWQTTCSTSASHLIWNVITFYWIKFLVTRLLN